MQVPRQWRMQQQRYNLTGLPLPQQELVMAGGAYDALPTAVEQQAEVSKTGTVYSFTVIHNPPAGFELMAPYYIGIIELDSGQRLTAQLTDVDGEPEIGMPVEMVTRRIKTDGEAGLISYGYKFRPIL